MILKASQRGGGAQLARHLLRTDENDHVHIHDMRGFTASDLLSAFKEAYAVSRGTKCRQFLFSVSLNPPPDETVSVDIFEGAISEIERKMGLLGQPRAIVFHEKEGRRHAHCVWSRIDVQKMKAINLPHFKMKLQDISRDLFIENDWQMPSGLKNTKERNPLNFSIAEWQQAKRIGRDPRIIKQTFQDCWAISDSAKSFANALREHGYELATGDRRGFVAIDWRGEVYAISRWTGMRAKEVRARLEVLHDLPSVDDARQEMNLKIVGKLKDMLVEADNQYEKAAAEFEKKRQRLVLEHRSQREALIQKQAQRRSEENYVRLARLPRGLKALWFRVTGQYRALKRRNELEAKSCDVRDKCEMDELVAVHLSSRQSLQHEKRLLRHRRGVLDRRLNLDMQSHALGVTPESARERPSQSLQARKLARRR